MRDPFPIPPIPALSRFVEPWAEKLHFPTLPLHIHEVVLGALFYTFVQVVVSPWISMRYWPEYYPRHSRGKKASWDSHVVSMVQSCLINLLALWVMWTDNERWNMDWEQRVWGYTGASGMVQGLAAGYFVWDLLITICYIDVFGLGLLAHATSALIVYSVGFRPFLNFYGCTFILYELSTPFLNIHWFFDKLGMTGSKAQLYNGIALILVFFSCRLIWGTVQSAIVYKDLWYAIQSGPTTLFSSPETSLNSSSVAYADSEITMFAKDAAPIPLWLAGLLVGSNLTLNCLNWHWFVKMIKAVRKRFEPPKGEKTGDKKTEAETPSKAVTSGLEKTLSLQELRKRAGSLPELVPTIEDDLAEMQ